MMLGSLFSESILGGARYAISIPLIIKKLRLGQWPF